MITNLSGVRITFIAERNIPELNMLPQVPVVILHRRLKRLGQQHVINHAEAAHTMMVEATEPGAEPSKMVEWASLWLKPAGMAAVVMLLFAFAFSGKKADESTPDGAGPEDDLGPNSLPNQ